MTVINPFDFFLQDEAIEYPFRYEDAVRTDLLPYLETLPCAAAAAGVPGRHSPQEQEDGRFPRRSESVRPQRGKVPDPHGAGRADVRGDAHVAERLVPRFGLAAGAGAAQPGPGRAVRFRLPDPVEAGHEAAGRPARTGHPTSPTCTPGPRSICPAPAGWGSIRPPACWRAKATCRWPPRPIPIRPRRFPAASIRARSIFPSRCRSPAWPMPRASPSPIRKSNGPPSNSSAIRSMPGWTPSTSASPWAASRPSCRSTTWKAPSGT